MADYNTNDYTRSPTAEERAAAWEKMAWHISFLRSINGSINPVINDIENWVNSHKVEPGMKLNKQKVNRAFWDLIAKMNPDVSEMNKVVPSVADEEAPEEEVKRRVGRPKKQLTQEELDELAKPKKPRGRPRNTDKLMEKFGDTEE